VQFCTARGQLAKSVIPIMPHFCSPQINCFSPADIAALALAPGGTVPETVVGGETIVTARFINCFAAEVGQLELTVSQDCDDEIMNALIISMRPIPSTMSGSTITTDSLLQCEIVFQAPAISCFTSCRYALYHLNIHLSDVIQQQADFKMWYVQRPVSAAELLYPAVLYRGIGSKLLLGLSNLASYAKLQAVSLKIAGKRVYNLTITSGDCQQAYLSAVLSDLDTFTSASITDAVVTSEYVSSFNDDSNFTRESVVYMNIFTGPAITMQHPTTLRSEVGGCMVLQVQIPFSTSAKRAQS
jgi:hypothetical protein